MKHLLSIILCVVFVATFASCNTTDDRTNAPSNSSVQSQSVSAETVNKLAWQPMDNATENADAANRRACGIIDMYDGIYYYQGYGDSECLYALLSYDPVADVTELLVEDCYGMINATSRGIFYIGYEDKGLFRYDVEEKSSEKICSASISNVVISRQYAYYITGGKKLYKVDLESEVISSVDLKNVSPGFLDIFDGYVYYSKLKSDRKHDLYKVNDDGVHEPECIIEDIEMPISYDGEKVICKNNSSIVMYSVDDGEEVSITEDKEIFSAAVNNNYVFYIEIDDTGYSELNELNAVNLDTGEHTSVVTVHGDAVYFINGELYTINTVTLTVEKVDLSQNDYSIKWVVE